MEWKVVAAFGLHAAAVASVIYLCFPATRTYVKARGLWSATTVGVLLGYLANSPPEVRSGNRPYTIPFDPNEPTGKYFGEYVFLENFTLALGVPFIVLALIVAFRRKTPTGNTAAETRSR